MRTCTVNPLRTCVETETKQISWQMRKLRRASSTANQTWSQLQKMLNTRTIMRPHLLYSIGAGTLIRYATPHTPRYFHWELGCLSRRRRLEIVLCSTCLDPVAPPAEWGSLCLFFFFPSHTPRAARLCAGKKGTGSGGKMQKRTTEYRHTVHAL